MKRDTIETLKEPVVRNHKKCMHADDNSDLTNAIEIIKGLYSKIYTFAFFVS